MDVETEKAVRGSILKWKKIIAGTGVDEGTHNCPLCEKFINRLTAGAQCPECPVQERASEKRLLQQHLCRNTPYAALIEHQEEDDSCSLVFEGMELLIDCPRCLVLAKEELTFLKSLLEPREEEDVKSSKSTA